MTALADALARTQSLGVVAIEKAYVAGASDQTEARELLESFGCNDTVELALLFAGLDVLRQFGAQPPQETPSYTERRKTEPLTEPQRARIERDLVARGLPPLDFAGITKEQASEIITQLKDGTYDAARWGIPF